MALINCPECKKLVSSLARTCPNCGYGINPGPSQSRTSYQTDALIDYLEKRRQRKIVAATIFIIVIVLFIILINVTH